MSGEPHLKASRLTTVTVSALAEHGYGVADIIALYPREDPEGIVQALELEAELAHTA